MDVANIAAGFQQTAVAGLADRLLEAAAPHSSSSRAPNPMKAPWTLSPASV